MATITIPSEKVIEAAQATISSILANREARDTKAEHGDPVTLNEEDVRVLF